MEMKSVANDKVGPGVETAKPKIIARKSTSVPRKREPKYDEDEDDVCAFRIYEVVGNVKDHPKAAAAPGKVKNPKKKPGESDDSIVIGDEVLLRITNAGTPSKKSKEEEFLDLASMIQAENAAKKKLLPFFQNKQPFKNPFVTSTDRKTITSEGGTQSTASDNGWTVTDTDSDVPEKEKTVTDSSYSSPKKADDDDDDKEIEKEKPVDEVSTMEELLDEGAAAENVGMMVEVNESDTRTNNEVSVAEENSEDKGKDDEKDVPDEGPSEVSNEVSNEVPEEGPDEVADEVLEEVVDEVPIEVPDDGPIEVPDDDPIEVPDDAPVEVPGDKIVQEEEPIDLMNEVEEVVLSSGSAWNNDDQPSSGFYGTTRNIDEDEGEDLVGELRIDEADSCEFSKKFKGDTVAKNGTAAEIRDGNIVEKAVEKDKGAIQDGEIGSVTGEIPFEERNKRKRIRKGGGTKKLSSKKRKVEKSRKNDSDDERDKGKSNSDKSSKKDFAKPGSSICDHSTLEETIDRVASGHLSLPFLENLRGEIKSLSRGDLEELIVQKLCEVITERSAVGHLRKRAEALEKSQERWKEKVLSLTKQIREMDMVMKNYLSEVRRHQNEKSFQMVAPLRVTRSVGLQVSFTSNPSKLAKTSPKSSVDLRHGRDKGAKRSHRNVQVSEIPNTNIPILPSTSSTNPIVLDSQNKFSTKSGLTITLQPASSSSEAQPATKPVQIQQPKLSILPASDSPSTSLIDLTGDDDRQTEDTVPDTSQQTVTVGPPGQVKVVNHIQPAQAPVGAVTLLISNPNNTPCCSSASGSGSSSDSQNRQLVIAGSSAQTTQRHILPAIPTLIYKTNALIQPGSQVATNQALSQGIKLTKHPAPLPQPPLNQMHKPNWKLMPPRPALKISKGDTGIVLSWNMALGPEYETIVSYQLFAYQESDSPPSSSMWKRVGDIKALRLPMACTLTQFLTGHRYYFAVRAVDMHSRVGPFSYPSSIALIG